MIATQTQNPRRWMHRVSRCMAGLGAGLYLAAVGPTAAAEPVGLPPQIVEWQADSAQAAAVVGIRPGWVVTVSFLDEDGRPWPIEELVAPMADASESTEWLFRPVASHSHAAMLQMLTGQRFNKKDASSGNVVAFLKRLPTPVHLQLALREGPLATQVEVRVQGAAHERAAPAAAGVAGLNEAGLADAMREYLLANPDVIREAMDPARQVAAQATKLRDELLGVEGVPAKGDASAAVTVVEFFDYRCGFCKRSLDAVRTALEQPGVRVELRDYPILGEDSVRAAQAALAAGAQGRYVDAHLALMAHEGDYDDAALSEIAAQLGLDAERLLEDMASAEVAARIEANRDLASRLGINGTPAFLVAGRERIDVAPGALDAARMREMIEAAQ